MHRVSHMDGELQILLVEDNPFDADLIEAALQARFGCLVTTVDSRAEFEAELERHSPDFILSDSNLPSFDGLTALALAKQKYPDTPFIFCSGHIPEEAKEEALARGAVACVSKDDLDGLVVIIGQLVQKRNPRSDTEASS
jgi:CheY-like chemotaxis protein